MDPKHLMEYNNNDKRFKIYVLPFILITALVCS